MCGMHPLATVARDAAEPPRKRRRVSTPQSIYGEQTTNAERRTLNAENAQRRTLNGVAPSIRQPPNAVAPSDAEHGSTANE